MQWKHLVDNEIPNAEQTVNYQNADDNAKTNFDDAKRLANTLLNSDNTNVNDINGAIQAVNDAIHNLNGDQRLQDAKDKAIQSINQALANKLKEIEASKIKQQVIRLYLKFKQQATTRLNKCMLMKYQKQKLMPIKTLISKFKH